MNKDNKKIISKLDHDKKKDSWSEKNSQKRHNNYVNIKSGAWKKKDFHHN